MRVNVKKLLRLLRAESMRRPERIIIRAMGKARYFHAYDRGADTFIFEKDVWPNLNQHASVLLAEKEDLRPGSRGRGHVMTVTTGNHSVAAIPLLTGRFWNLARLAANQQSDVMLHAILCANVVNGSFEISQRDVPCEKLAALDRWLTDGLGVALEDVVMAERNDATLAHYRRLGQEWRVKPLAWTEREMTAALAASRKRISTAIRYYHGVRGVHFLTYPEFHAFAERARTDYAAFRAQLKELAGVFEGEEVPFTRLKKCNGRHEIEFFGTELGVAVSRLVPVLEKLHADVTADCITQDEAVKAISEADGIFRSLLAQPAFADSNSPAFVETLYMYLTGEIYAVEGDGTSRAFDDRRTALPGATFIAGHAVFHPGADVRSEVLLSSIRGWLNKDEVTEYANVYELRDDARDKSVPLGEGPTREVVYKSSFHPLPTSLIEKRLSHPGRGYGGYVIARVEALKALGVDMANYRLLHHRATPGGRAFDHYIRTRCEGEPLMSIPASFFRLPGGSGHEEDPRAVLQLAIMAGDAAAQHFTMLKYDTETGGTFYGCGKEIYRIGYDVHVARPMVLSVSICSIRGSFGKAVGAQKPEELDDLARFYFRDYAHVLNAFAAQHPSVSREELADRFWEGFYIRLRALAWQLTVRRDTFSDFNPELPTRFSFAAKWRYVMWHLEKQAERLDVLKTLFRDMVFGENR